MQYRQKFRDAMDLIKWKILYRVGTAVNDAGDRQSSSAVWAYPGTVRRRLQTLTSGVSPPSKLFVKVLDFSRLVA